MLGDILGGAVNLILQPVADAIDIVDGLTEGELRERAIVRLGSAVVAGMAVHELIEWYQNEG